MINGADSIMRVLTIEEAADSAVLRAVSSDLSAEALLSADFERLAELMLEDLEESKGKKVADCDQNSVAI